LLPALLGAVLMGIIYHFVARFLDLIILFPLATGGIVGGIIAALAKKNKVRSKGALAFVGILCGLLCYGTKEFSDSLYDREMSIPAMATEFAGKNQKLATLIEDSLRKRYPPLAYFPIYLQGAAEQGISISSTHDFSNKSRNAPITGWGFWAFFILDGLLITGAATAIAWGQANQLFCEPCDNWYTEPMTVTRLHPDQGEEATRLVQSGDFTGLGNLRGEGAGEKLHCDVLLSKCNGCGVGHLKMVTTRDKSVKTIWEGDPTPKDIATLEEVRAQWLK
jgi:hypothetical protein